MGLHHRALTAAGAVLAAAGVALSAYAAHTATGDVRSSLQTAALFAFGHGVALAALSRGAQRRLALIALAGLLLGTLLFAGALVAAQTLGMPARTAPFGGSLLIVAWLLFAIDALRR
ncbi:MAG: DUF423 domain-containing protein [Luteimonas sp.]